jgi:hypothetical protein
VEAQKLARLRPQLPHRALHLGFGAAGFANSGGGVGGGGGGRAAPRASNGPRARQASWPTGYSGQTY